MPEGDTIYRAARAMQRALGGKVVTGFETGLAKIARVNDDAPLVGRTVERVESRGKWCLLYFSGDLILVTHMLMSGSWHLYRTGEKWWMGKDRMRVAITVGEGANSAAVEGVQEGGAGEAEPGVLATRSKIQGSFASVLRTPLRMTAQNKRQQQQAQQREQRLPQQREQRQPQPQDAGWQAVAFNVPVVEFHTARSLERSSQVPKLGPDVLSDEFTVEGGVERMRGYGEEHPEAEVAVVLLNQRVLAGLGNVYKSEVAFAAGVNPFRAMRTITDREMEVMVEKSQQWLRANVIDGNSATGGDQIVTYSGNRRTTGRMDRAERLWVYGRQGQECRRCGATVMMRKQGEQARSTYWCPECQPWVAAEGQSATAPVGGSVGSRRRKVGC